MTTANMRQHEQFSPFSLCDNYGEMEGESLGYRKCPMGDLKSNVSLFVVGESHALMWLRGFGLLGERLKLRVQMIGLWGICSPWNWIIEDWPRNEIGNVAICMRYHVWFYDMLARFKPKYVVIGFWAEYQAMTDYALLTRSALAFVDKLRFQFGTKVLLIRDTPTHLSNMIHTVAANLNRVSITCPNQLAEIADRSQFTGRQGKVREWWKFLQEIAAVRPGVVFLLDSHRFVCGTTRCPCIVDNVLVKWCDGYSVLLGHLL